MTKPSRSCLVAILALGLAAGARADSSDLAEPQRLVAAGELVAAQVAYSRLLDADPRRVDARLGRAYARAFQRDLPGARADFEDVLAAEPRNAGALTGLGFTLAWSGAYLEAEEQLQRALEVAPDSRDAAKGLAYVALWRGDAGEATRRFEAMADHAPPSAEIHLGLGRALLAGGHRREARAAFTRALEIEPASADAKRALADVPSAAVRLEATVFGGLSEVGGRGGGQAGVRFAEVAITPTERTRFWAQVDDSLSLDNVGLAQQNAHAPTYYLGGLARYGARFTTRLEAGFRSLPGGIDEGIARAEQVVMVGEGTALKVGAWLGARADDRVEAVGHTGASFPLSARLRLEPTVFYARSGAAGEHDLRAQLALAYRFSRGLELGGGAAAGRAFSPNPAAAGTPGSAFLRASAPISGGVRAHLLVNHDRPTSGAPTTVYALGLTLALGDQR